MHKQTFSIQTLVSFLTVGINFWDLLFGASVTPWDGFTGKLMTTSGKVTKITVKLKNPPAPLDVIIQLTVNGVGVFDVPIKTTDQGMLEFTPNIAFNANDLLGYETPDATNYSVVPSGTIATEVELD